MHVAVSFLGDLLASLLQKTSKERHRQMIKSGFLASACGISGCNEHLLTRLDSSSVFHGVAHVTSWRESPGLVELNIC